jgi:predicted metal-dependent hydrolase
VVRVFEYGGEAIHYEVKFLPTRQTLGIEVHPDQRVLVRAPVDCPEKVIAERVRKRASWISRQISEFQRYSPRTPPRQYVSGETHLYLGRQYRLQVRIGESASAKLSRGQFIVALPGKTEPEQVKATLQHWYFVRAKKIFEEVLDTCFTRFKDHPRPRLSIRSMQSRWGSLSPRGTMTLNVNLIKAPRACIEYVVTHELCHLRYRDHNASFYRWLAQVMPDWEKRKQQLEAVLL